MLMTKTITRHFSENVYVFLGLIVGIYISLFFSNNLESEQSCGAAPTIRNETAQRIIRSSVNNLAPPLNADKAAAGPKKSKLVRPRYYSTELGIREKLFVGVFSSEEKVNTRAVHINNTVGHLVDKIKFFITAQYKLKTRLNLTGLVGFTDARARYRPFQIFKYVGDTYPDDYDYYFFSNDYTYINAHRLRDVLNKISVGTDLYLGTRVEDGSYCKLDAGLVVSNSVLKAMRSQLEWCIINAVSDDPSENIGRCVYHSAKLSCQEVGQGQTLPSVRLKHFDLREHLAELSKKETFNRAATVYPVLQKEDFYLLNAYFLKQRLKDVHDKIDKLSEELSGSWPPGQREGATPATRFDMPRRHYFNLSHVFFPDDFTAIRKHTESELIDIENILEEIKGKVSFEYGNTLGYDRLVNGYKTFDLSRGMDYTFDLAFRDSPTGKETIKRFEVCKPLGGVELIQMPYVTENSRLTVLLPIQEWEVSTALDFVSYHASTILERKEKTVLMLVFLYQYESSSKGSSDVFSRAKDTVTRLASKWKGDDTKILWLSVRLPQNSATIALEENPVLNFAVADLAMKKLGSDGLVLFSDARANMSADFLNRARMNAVEGRQVFSAVPFRLYDPRAAGARLPEVGKRSGRFDATDYRFAAFHGRDYVAARRRQQKAVPLVRVDNDAAELLRCCARHSGNIFGMFVEFGGAEVHAMRATEAGLRLAFREGGRADGFSGNEAELAALLLSRRAAIQELQ